ncbi:hypothetical protein M514_14518 [Trichuris suis]|uniref:Uncharacterized protein n=1 Tax=Trichuris suis TaxID=68888 RepID=A0A085NUN2_9BILA|nr:hypothetical protein M514_14518 [Trichuris suis]
MKVRDNAAGVSKQQQKLPLNGRLFRADVDDTELLLPVNGCCRCWQFAFELDAEIALQLPLSPPLLSKLPSSELVSSTESKVNVEALTNKQDGSLRRPVQLENEKPANQNAHSNLYLQL